MAMTTDQFSAAEAAISEIPDIGRRRLIKLTGCTGHSAAKFLEAHRGGAPMTPPKPQRLATLMSETMPAEAKLRERDNQLKALKRERDELLAEFIDFRNARPVPKAPRVARKRSETSSRVSVGDVHGMMMDKAAVAAFLTDVKTIDPDEVVLGGDILECGGWLAKHQPLGFVANCDYSFQEDVRAANWFLDELQKAAPNAVIHYIEGNHEDRVERWAMDAAMAHRLDVEFLMAAFGPKAVLRLEERGINWYNRHEVHGKGLMRGWIKLGKMFFTHSLTYSKNAARDAVGRTAGNITYWCCFSPDTEILTRSGWKLFKGLAAGEEVLTMNKDTGVGEWQTPSDIIRRHDKPEYVHFKTAQIDALVTPDHAMATISRQTRVPATLAERLPVKRIQAHEVAGKRFAIPLSTVPDTGTTDYPISDDMLALLGWVITEGSFETQGSMRIAQADQGKGLVEEIETLLTRLGASYSKYRSHKAGGRTDGRARNYDQYSFYLPRADTVTAEVKRLVPDKCMQWWMLGLSDRQFKLLLHTLIAGDGSTNKTAKEHCVQYGTISDANCDVFQALCALHGYRTSSTVRRRSKECQPLHCISACSRGYGHINPDNATREPTNGVDVWCVAVPNQTVVVRRKGKVFVCGNTHREDTATIVFPGVGICKAFNPGCMCSIMPIYRHTNPTSWSQGYAIDFVARSGNFQRIQVPIWDGESLASSIINRFKS